MMAHLPSSATGLQRAMRGGRSPTRRRTRPSSRLPALAWAPGIPPRNGEGEPPRSGGGWGCLTKATATRPPVQAIPPLL